MGCIEHEARQMEFLTEIDGEFDIFETGMGEFMKNPPTKSFDLFYLSRSTDGLLRPTIELCEALKGKTDDLWVKKPHETTFDEDLIRCVAIGRYLSFKVLADDVLADETGNHSFDFDGYPNYKLTTEVKTTHDGSDHMPQERLYIILTPVSLFQKTS